MEAVTAMGSRSNFVSRKAASLPAGGGAVLICGVAPWVHSWSQTPGLNIAANAATGAAYRGINQLLILKVHGQHAFTSAVE
jgi:hypothetical protein